MDQIEEPLLCGIDLLKHFGHYLKVWSQACKFEITNIKLPMEPRVYFFN